MPRLAPAAGADAPAAGPVTAWFVRLHLPVTAVLIMAATLSGSIVFVDAVYLVVWGGTIAALVLRARHRRGPDGRPWRVVAAGTTVAAAAMVVEQAARYGGWAEVVRTELDVAYLAGLGVVGLGAQMMVQRRAPHNDNEGLLDGTIVAITMATVFGALLTVSPMPDVDATALSPLATFVMSLVAGAAIALCLRLVFLDPQVRAAWLLLASGVSALTWSASSLLVAQAGVSVLRTQYVVALIMASVLLLGRAALHPSAAQLTRPVAATPWTLPRARLVLLGLALTVAPLRMVVHRLVDGRLSPLDVAPIVLTLLVMVQVGTLLKERERTRHQAELGERQQAGVAELGMLAVRDVDLRHLLTRSAEVVHRTLGVAAVQIEVTGDGATTLVHPEGAHRVRLHDLAVYDGFDRVRLDDAGLEPLDGTAGALACEQGAAIGTVLRGRHGAWGLLLAFPGQRRDFTRHDIDFLSSVGAVLAGAVERDRAEQRLRYLALYDPLTGLPNRTLFLDRVSQALAAQTRSTGHLGVLFVDLDGFKQINDTLGHDAGDQLLARTAGRVRGAVRDGEAARLAGDEFVVLVTGLPNAAAIHEVAERVVRALDEPFRLDTGTATIGASVGVVVSTPDDDPETLLRRADRAMYRAKRGGKGRVAIAA